MADEEEGFDWGSFFEGAVQVAALAATAYNVSQKFGGDKQKASGTNLLSLKQPYPSKIYHIGDYSRGGGAFDLWRAKGNLFYIIKLVNAGRIDSFKDFWLNDDKVTINAGGEITSVTKAGADVDDGRYRDDSTQPSRVIFKTRLGLPTETAYAEAVASLSPEWTTAHRGDNIASIMIKCLAPQAKWFRQAFPNGLPELTYTARGVCWDWRDGTQDREDPATWKWSANPIVWGVHMSWLLWGMDFDRCIDPVIDQLTSEANACDEAVGLKAGGTENRYRLAYNYAAADVPPEQVRKVIADSMAGKWGRDLRGRLVLRAGVWREPEVTIERKFIRGFTFSRGQEEEDKVREYFVTIKNPTGDYLDLPLAPVRIGTGGKSEQLPLEGVYSQTQGQRIAKIMLGRNRFRPESIQMTDYGLSVWNEPRIKLSDTGFPALDAVAIAPIMPSIENLSADITMGYRIDLADFYAWNPATDEADLVTPIVRPDIGALTEPEIDSIAVIGTAALPQLRITASGPDRIDLTWVLYWRVLGSDSWISESFSAYDDLGGGQVQFTTSVVQSSSTIEAYVEYRTAAGTPSPPSDIEAVDSSAIAPAPPTSVSGFGSAGNAAINFRAPTSPANYDHIEVWRNSVNNFGTSSQVGGDLPVGAGAVSTYNDTISAGTYYYWVLSSSASGLKSSPVATGSVTVT